MYALVQRDARKDDHLHVRDFCSSLPRLVWALANGCPRNYICRAAAAGGHLEALKFARGQDPPCEWSDGSWWGGTCTAAAKGGHLDVLKWARSQSPPAPWDWTTLRYAAEGEHLEVMKWAREQIPPCEWGQVSCCTIAAREGKLEFLQGLRALVPPCPWDENACAAAAGGGQLDVLKWMREQDPPCEWSAKTCIYAAEAGHLEILMWAREQQPPCPWSFGICVLAAKEGRLDVLTWARAQDPPCEWVSPSWPTEVCSEAARAGQLETLQWLRDQDDPCPWDELALWFAAEEGHLEVVKWAWLHGCPWSEEVCSRAARRGHLDILQWVRAQNPPCPWGPATCRGAASSGHLDILKWAREHGCPWDEWSCSFAAMKGHLDVLQWARQQEPPCPWDAGHVCGEAARGRHFEICAWVTDQLHQEINGISNTIERSILMLKQHLNFSSAADKVRAAELEQECAPKVTTALHSVPVSDLAFTQARELAAMDQERSAMVVRHAAKTAEIDARHAAETDESERAPLLCSDPERDPETVDPLGAPEMWGVAVNEPSTTDGYFGLLPDDILRNHVIPKLDDIDILDRFRLSHVDRRTRMLLADGGHLDLVKWALAQNPPCSFINLLFISAASSGNLELMHWWRTQYSSMYQWPREDGCPWDENTSAYTAKAGQFEALKWIRGQQPPCPWDSRTCSYLAEGGHLDVLQWAREQVPPCPWEFDDIWRLSVQGGHSKVCAWAMEQLVQERGRIHSIIRQGNLAVSVSLQRITDSFGPQGVSENPPMDATVN